MAPSNKYESIRDQVLDLIGTLEVGAAIPPERELCQRFGVSRMTLRRALDELAREGVVERHQGRGTFVAAPKIAQQLEMTSFSDDMRRRGMVPGSRTLTLSRIAAGAPLGRRLDVSPRATVLRVRRLRLADHEPMAIETLHVPEDLVPGLDARDLTDTSFYDLLEDRYGLAILWAEQTIEPTVVNAEEAAELAIPEHSPAFLFERTSRADDGRIVEFVRSIYRGDRYQLLVELRPPRGRVARADDRARAVDAPAPSPEPATSPEEVPR